MRTFYLLAAATAWLSLASSAWADGNLTHGRSIFQTQCTACHSATAGQNGFGPSLNGVVGRKAGSLTGFNFTPALQASGLTWDAKTLNDFLTNPTQKVPGTAMAAIVASASDRADLIAYLATLTVAPSTAAPAAAPAVPLGTVQGPTQAQLDGAQKNTRDWLYASHDYTGQRYVDLAQVTVKNAAQLRAQCIYRSSTATPMQTNPIVYDGTMYLTLGRATVAIDAET